IFVSWLPPNAPDIFWRSIIGRLSVIATALSMQQMLAPESTRAQTLVKPGTGILAGVFGSYAGSNPTLTISVGPTASSELLPEIPGRSSNPHFVVAMIRVIQHRSR